ncbi:MAG: HAMP domain-containing sensor histidine kinase [Paenibacillus macerans]|uniref:histidine kinase n=2 Tax=Paenibacillus TaxID=44249 RepID=A0A090ZFL9_PAEMA|nr:HAMP domain-containing sensor histidine kinase [Paenibacillus macerans]KFN10079.1 his Kinase A domain protein [Paenibacillus macerans]MBS5912844.1 HAMP domain-containing histidine kinase [Paenibacillus macerans]MCY7560961.1 HAMP domain-containing histidine kinase [Paenibacillus macerans]MDU5948931.1 HAMP domain-containing sensor histidine kinase [Paenibacillus macerans]MDU7473380.1 HAMP domain-containing sensor histidine kinase [Paenibacillus macerans]
MMIFNYLCLGVAASAVIGAAITVFLYRKYVRNTLKTIDNMITAAIDGSFSEHVFDESLLSSVEAKCAQFLSIYSVSSQKLLAEKNKINKLISDIAHQTKTPVANILLYSQLLGEYDLPQDVSICVKALNSQAEKLHFLTDVLVKTSQLETGIISVSPRRETVQKLLDYVRHQVFPKAEAKGISLAIPDTAIHARFDLKWTAEAVYNVVDNAVKYTDKGGSIVVRVSEYELFCRIDITDTGIGIAEEEQTKIFKRFYRSPAVQMQEGVGIGLFLTREILTAEGGYIRVKSDFGSGSTFSIFLPIDKFPQ